RDRGRRRRAPGAPRRGRLGLVRLHLDRVELPRSDVVDEGMHFEAVRQQGRFTNPPRAGAYALGAVAEGLEVDVARIDTLPLFERRPKVVVREGEHPAVGVPDDEGLLRAEQVVRDDERTDRVVTDDAS